jgi:hypothetical protein
MTDYTLRSAADDITTLPDHAFHQPGAQVTQPAAPPSVFDQAISQYPVLKRSGVSGTISPNLDNGQDPLHGGGFLEFWAPGNGGAPQYPRPQSLPMDSPGVEIRSAKTRPIDVLGDVVSHHLINTDPKISGYYQQFQNSLTADQHARLQEQYQYAQKNLGETRPYAEWAQASGLPAYFRGYAFQQWPSDFNQQAYTPQQRAMFDEMMNYLQTRSAPSSVPYGRPQTRLKDM